MSEARTEENFKFSLNPDLRQYPDAKADIKALATDALKAEYLNQTDKQIFLEGVICDAGWDLSLTDRPTQWERVIGWLEEEMPDG